MWPPSSKIILSKMKTYLDPKPSLPPLILEENVLSTTPHTISDCLRVGQAWKQKMDPILSSPLRQGFNQYLEGIEVILRVSHMEQVDLIQIRLAAKEA
jgi:hypothetical protein